MGQSYSMPATDTVTTDWRGISHARMTASMENLTPVAFKSLAILRRRWRDMESRRLTVRDAGDMFGCSAATAGKVLQELEQAGFILRSACGLSYVVTLLPPPELENRSESDRPSAPSRKRMNRTRSTPTRSESDRPTIHAHEHVDQQQQHDAAAEKFHLPETPLVRALRADHAHAKVIKKILDARPDRTVDEYYRQLALARLRPGLRSSPEAFVFGLWMRGEDVSESASSNAGETYGAETQGRSASDPDHHSRHAGSSRGSDHRIPKRDAGGGDWTPDFNRPVDPLLAAACQPNFAKLAAQFGDDVYDPATA